MRDVAIFFRRPWKAIVHASAQYRTRTARLRAAFLLNEDTIAAEFGAGAMAFQSRRLYEACVATALGGHHTCWEKRE